MADVVAVGRHGRGYRRTQFVIDVSGEEPGIIYRRNLAPLGWALGQETQRTLAMERSLAMKLKLDQLHSLWRAPAPWR
jgi:hypothetical protein